MYATRGRGHNVRWLPQLGAVGSIFVDGDAGPAQGIGERATRRGLISARRWGAWAGLGTSGHRAGAARIATDLVVETQRQRDSLSRSIDVQDLDPDDVAGLHDFARVLHEVLCHRRDVHQAILMHPDVDEGTEG